MIAAPAIPSANRPIAAGSGIEVGLPPDDPPPLPEDDPGGVELLGGLS